MFSTRCVSVTYNMATLYEDSGDMTEADRLYTGILREHPNYSPCAWMQPKARTHACF